MKENLNEYIGKKFGDWLVIGIGEPKFYSNGKNKSKQKLDTLTCICECGYCNKTVKDITLKQIKGKKGIKNCGNKGRIKTGKNNKKRNEYNLKNTYGIGHTSKGEIFYFDLEDYELIKDYCWHKHQDGYMRTFIKVDNEMLRILMHNLVFKKENLNNDIDHINGNKVDNRKINLRECSHCDNMKNTKLRNDNKSGIIGVYLLNNKWKANITVNKQQIYLGTFLNKTDATIARLNAEKEYFGEFAPQKHLFEQYNVAQ